MNRLFTSLAVTKSDDAYSIYKVTAVGSVVERLKIDFSPQEPEVAESTIILSFVPGTRSILGLLVADLSAVEPAKRRIVAAPVSNGAGLMLKEMT